jgi:hypothetical protein
MVNIGHFQNRRTLMNTQSNQGNQDNQSDNTFWTMARAGAVGVGILFGGPITYAVMGTMLAYHLFSRETERTTTTRSN